MSVYDWSTIAGDNANADANINWTEGQNPNTVNNSARALMAAVAALLAQASGQAVAGGGGNAYTLTSPSGHAFTAYGPGMLVCFLANHSNTAAATLNVDGLGAKPLKKYGDAALTAGDIDSGNLVFAIYDGANFQVQTALGNANVQAFAALAGAADKLSYFTGGGALTLTDLTAFARTLLGGASDAAMRSTLGLGSIALLNSINNGNWSGVDLDIVNGGTGASNASGARSNLGIGSMAERDVTISTAAPSGGANGDVWLRYV